MNFLGYELKKDQKERWVYSVFSDFEEATVTVEKHSYKSDITDMPYTFCNVYSKEHVISTLVNILKEYPGIESCAMGSG